MRENRTKVFYVGMTSDLAGCAFEHREWVLDGFTKRYWVDRLVYFVAREKRPSH